MGLAFTRRRTIFVPDVMAEDRWADPDRVYRSGLRSIFTVPMVHEFEALGVVGLDSPRFTSETPPAPADLTRAALPESLVESELFGHEKGPARARSAARPVGSSWPTGARCCWMKIGDLPAQAQAKLLRVRQEREVLRIGGTRPVPVNVRLVAATNQDLDTCLAAGRFRLDLFYRLDVFRSGGDCPRP
jgi:hypothetical protein